MAENTLLYDVLSYVGAFLVLSGAAFSFLRARRGGSDARALYALCFTLAMWGTIYLITSLHPPQIPLGSFRPMSVYTLTVGNLFVIFCLPYPLELAHPGWITFRRVALLITPYVSITLFYFAMLALLEEPVRDLRNIPDLLSGLNEFNVWFRVVLYFSVCGYIVYLLMNTGVRALESRHGNDAPDPRKTRRLLIYGIGMALITAAYLIGLLYDSMEILTIHRAITVTFFTIVIFTTFRPGTAAPETSPGT